MTSWVISRVLQLVTTTASLLGVAGKSVLKHTTVGSFANVLQHPFSIAQALIYFPYIFVSIYLSDAMTDTEIPSVWKAWLASPNLELSYFFHYPKKSFIYLRTGQQLSVAHTCTLTAPWSFLNGDSLGCTDVRYFNTQPLRTFVSLLVSSSPLKKLRTNAPRAL